MGIWDSIGNWASNHAGDLIGTALTVGGGIYQANQTRNQARERDAMLRQMAQDDYNQQLAAYNARGSGGGGGGGGGFDASGYMAALRAKQKEQAAFIKKAMELQKKQYEIAQGYYAPYREAGTKLLPGVTATYQGGLDLTKLLAAYLQAPSQMQKLNGDTSALGVKIDLPEHLKYGK